MAADQRRSSTAHEEILRLRKALEQAVSVIRVWHGMGQKPSDDDAFDIYFNHSPEMKPIRDVLGKMREVTMQRVRATPSPYDCGGNPTKDYPGE